MGLRPPSLRTSLGCTLLVLDTSVRFLMASRRGEATMALTDDMLRAWARATLRRAQCEVSAGGLEHVTPGKSFVVMSNHASFFDIPALYATFPGTLRMVGKAELFKVPIWGPAMREAGHVAINRGDRATAIAQLATAEALLKDGTCVWISPEGTRSKTGDLSPFKKGGFHMALHMGVPILPAYISGTAEVMPPDSIKVSKGGRVHVEYGEAIPVPAGGARDMTAFMATVEGAIRQLGDSSPR